nr:nuclear transport factor 2 family protein [Acidobacteriota bacterium]
KYKLSRSDRLKVRVYGETAVVTGRATVKGKYKGMDISGQYRYTHVFVKQRGHWLVVTAQQTRVLPSWLYFLATRVAKLFRA